MKKYTFPFGQKVKPVLQQDKKPKKVFILGVYASAVHARWIGDDGKVKIQALAVASEPYIFWRGDGVEKIVSSIKLPKGAGKLVPAAANLNGPSGNTLDEAFIKSLGLAREDCWLCDIYPHSCLNPKQQSAIAREYAPLAKKLNLPTPKMPSEPKVDPGKKRAEEILKELIDSKADTIVLLGDLPIKWWLRHFDKRWIKLSDFGEDDSSYGQIHECEIEGKKYKLLPLVHPRQAGKLGAHSGKWATLHANWIAGKEKEAAAKVEVKNRLGEINEEIDHLKYTKALLDDKLAALELERDEQWEDDYLKEPHTKHLAEFFLERGLYISELKTGKRSEYYDVAKKIWKAKMVLVPFVKKLSLNSEDFFVYDISNLTTTEVSTLTQFCKSLTEKDWFKYKLLKTVIRISPSYTKEQKRFLQSGWSEEISIYLIDKTLKEFIQTHKLRSRLFWNVELRYVDPEYGQIYTELDLVAQVQDRLYIFEIKCGQNLRIDKWVERADLFQDENTTFITSTAIDKLNPMIFSPYMLFTLTEIEEQFTKMLEKDFPD